MAPDDRIDVGRRTHLRYPIGLLLAVLISVPLAGAAWFAVDHARDASSQRAQASTVNESVRHLVVVTELRARLLDERNWSSAVGALDEIGIDHVFVTAIMGIDIHDELATARSEVDVLVVELGASDVAAEVAELRASEDIGIIAVALGYDTLEGRFEAESEETLDDLMERAGRLGDADELITSLRILQVSTDARQAISDEFTAFFAAQFSPGSSTASRLQATVEQRAIRANAESDIRRLAVDGSHVQQTFASISSSEAASTFDAAVAGLLQEQATIEEGDISAVLEDVAGVIDVFTASSQTTDLYFDLVDAAGTDVLEASGALSTNAADEVNRAVVIIAVLVLASLVIGFAATQAIRRPVRLLADLASRISGGDSEARFATTGGPVEIRAAGRALDEAAQHLRLAEQQAKALADGDLEHPILSHQNAGALGASLQHAVSALATSMQEREEFRRRMTHEATHDGLTGIANRNSSLAQLNRALARTGRSGASLAVLFIDLDDFKSVNDNYGHRAGDTVLRTIAQRMVNTVRAGDHVGRLGGDEFVVIAEPVEGIDDAVMLAERVLEALAEPIVCDGTLLAVRASIGISMSNAFAEPESDQAGGTELLRDADLAVYKAKNEGRGRIELCDDDLRAEMYERADLEKALRQAIDDDEFILYYQPIITPSTGSLHGLEALIR